MTIDQLAKALRRSTLFRRLDANALTALAAKVIVAQYAVGDVIFSKGSRGDRMMIVLTGRVKITTHSRDGHEAIIDIVYPGEAFGEVSLLDGRERSADAVALGDSTLLVVKRNAFRDCIDQYPQFAIEVIDVLCERLRETTTFLEETLFLEVPERLFSRLTAVATRAGTPNNGKRVRIDHELSQEELGQSIGAARESVNKQLHDWKSQGLIDFGRGYVLVHDMKTLRAAALRHNLIH